MTALLDALYARMAGNAPLVALLAPYTDGQGVVSPGVFTHGPVPRNAVRPYVVVPGVVTGVNWDTKDRNGFEVTCDITCVCDETGTSAPVDAIAAIVQSLFHKYDLLAVEGYTVLIAWAGPPTMAPTDETLIGRRVAARWILRAA